MIENNNKDDDIMLPVEMKFFEKCKSSNAERQPWKSVMADMLTNGIGKMLFSGQENLYKVEHPYSS